MDTKALRQKILDLAIRGKLVPQDPNDEPASVLLERIRAEKQQMVKEGKLKAKDIKGDTIIFKGEDNLHYEKFADGTVKCIEDEIPFEVPEGWEWSRLNFIISIATDYVANGSFKTLKDNVRTYKEPNYALFVRTVDFSNNFTKDLSYIDEESYNFLGKSKLFGGELMLSNIGASIGKVFKIPYFECPMSLAPNSIILRFFNDVTSDYFEYVFKSFVGQNYLTMLTAGTAMPKFSKTELKHMLVPIPPLGEQEKIIKQCRICMKLVDTAEQEKEMLLHIIDDTKAKILDLAIRGKLVPQDPNDEPASVLLERIRAEKEELIKQGKIKRDKKESIIFRGDDNSYYDDIPNGWEVCYLKELFNICSAKRVKQSDWCTEGVPFYRAREIVKLSDNDFVDNELYISEDHYQQVKKECGIPQPGDLMVSGVGTIGKVYIVKDTDRFYYKDASVLCFENRSGIIDSKYARYMLMSEFIQNQMRENSKGTTVDTITISAAMNYICLLPPINEQKRIVSTIEQILNYLNIIESELS